MWRLTRVLGVLSTPGASFRSTIRSVRVAHSETTMVSETNQLPALSEGAEVIGPSVFETEANQQGYPVIPVEQVKELLPKIEAVLPIPHDITQAPPACIIWRLRQTVAPPRHNLYFVPPQHLKLVRWVSPKELENYTRGIITPTPNPK